MWDWTHPNRFFRPLKFLHALDAGQGLLAHTTNWVLVPPKFEGWTFKIALKIPHMRIYNFVGSGCNLMKFYQGMWLIVGMITWTLILQGVAPTKFGRVKTSKIQCNFWQLSSLIANISGTDRHIENPRSTWKTTFHPVFGVKNLVNFGPLTKSYRHSCWFVGFFRDTKFRPLEGAGPWNFYTCYRLTR